MIFLLSPRHRFQASAPSRSFATCTGSDHLASFPFNRSGAVSYPHQLSGGQRQRDMIACAILSKKRRELICGATDRAPEMPGHESFFESRSTISRLNHPIPRGTAGPNASREPHAEHL